LADENNFQIFKNIIIGELTSKGYNITEGQKYYRICVPHSPKFVKQKIQNHSEQPQFYDSFIFVVGKREHTYGFAEFNLYNIKTGERLLWNNMPYWYGSPYSGGRTPQYVLVTKYSDGTESRSGPMLYNPLDPHDRPKKQPSPEEKLRWLFNNLPPAGSKPE
jgi:hypothetical protein